MSEIAGVFNGSEKSGLLYCRFLGGEDLDGKQNSGNYRYDALTASMINCSGVAGETVAVMQDKLQSKVEKLGGALESLAIKISEYVIPFLTGLVESIKRRPKENTYCAVIPAVAIKRKQE